SDSAPSAHDVDCRDSLHERRREGASPGGGEPVARWHRNRVHPAPTASSDAFLPPRAYGHPAPHTRTPPAPGSAGRRRGRVGPLPGVGLGGGLAALGERRREELVEAVEGGVVELDLEDAQ